LLEFLKKGDATDSGQGLRRLTECSEIARIADIADRRGVMIKELSAVRLGESWIYSRQCHGDDQRILPMENSQSPQPQLTHTLRKFLENG